MSVEERPSSELKPCPFCGGDAVLGTPPGQWEGYGMRWPTCYSCSISLPTIEQWNTRMGPGRKSVCKSRYYPSTEEERLAFVESKDIDELCAMPYHFVVDGGNLTTRLSNALARNRVFTIKDLYDLAFEHQFGAKSLGLRNAGNVTDKYFRNMISDPVVVRAFEKIAGSLHGSSI